MTTSVWRGLKVLRWKYSVQEPSCKVQNSGDKAPGLETYSCCVVTISKAPQVLRNLANIKKRNLHNPNITEKLLTEPSTILLLFCLSINIYKMLQRFIKWSVPVAWITDSLDITLAVNYGNKALDQLTVPPDNGIIINACIYRDYRDCKKYRWCATLHKKDLACQETHICTQTSVLCSLEIDELLLFLGNAYKTVITWSVSS